jgi:hypothetical protein
MVDNAIPQLYERDELWKLHKFGSGVVRRAFES